MDQHLRRTAEICENCRFWQNWEDRVHMAVKSMRGAEEAGIDASMYGGTIAEIRLCQFRPSPNVEELNKGYYVGALYGCSNFERKR